MERDEEFYNAVADERISARQVDELIGLARGLVADGQLNDAEVRFLHTWLAANAGVSGQPLIASLYRRVSEILSDGVVDTDERAELLQTLDSLSTTDVEIGEQLKSTSLPLCNPAPNMTFPRPKLLSYWHVQLRQPERLRKGD